MAESNLTKMRNFRKMITDVSFKEGAGAREVVDIITDYAWTADTIGSGESIQINRENSKVGVNSFIPFCSNCFASSIMSSYFLLTYGPLIKGIAQYVQLLLHPSAIFKYA